MCRHTPHSIWYIPCGSYSHLLLSWWECAEERWCKAVPLQRIRVLHVSNMTICNKCTKLLFLFFYRGWVLMMLTRFLIQKVAQDAAQYSLVTYNKHIILMFQLQKHRVQSCHDVNVRFAPRIPVTKLILVSPSKFLRKLVLHFLISQTFTDTLHTTFIFNWYYH